MSPMLKFLAPATAILLAGCQCREPNYSNYGQRPHEWSLPGPEDERKVFGPVAFEEVRTFIAARQSEGWELIGFEPASIPEEVMINTVELDRPVDRKEGARTSKSNWTFDIPKTYDDGVEAPKKSTVPPYLDEGVKPYRQKYLVVMKRWR